jgi:uroporphyrinogen-III synthase
MAAGILILRPQPGADATAKRAAALGLEAVVAPLFEVEATAWHAPDPAGFDGIVLTSANAVRLAGSGLAAFLGLPCFAVGDATADAARTAGFRSVVAGDGDASSLAQLTARHGARRLLHLHGRDSKPVAHPELQVTERAVYRSEALRSLPEAAHEAIRAGTVALLHSPRAGATLAALLDASSGDRRGVRLAAISPAALAAAGFGWGTSLAAREPRDDALLAVAAKLCNMAPDQGTTS